LEAQTDEAPARLPASRRAARCPDHPACGWGLWDPDAFGGGLARGSTIVSNTEAFAWGPVVSARLWTPEVSTGGLLALDLQPFRVQDPVRDEHFRVLYVQPQLQLRPAPFFVRFGAGIPLFCSAGNDPAQACVGGFAVGAGVGIDVSGILRRDWSVEGFWRRGGWFGSQEGGFFHEVGLLGVQISVYGR
jgi:hypothetical protein